MAHFTVILMLSSLLPSLAYMVEPKNKLEPVDIEFEVGSEFLLSDSQEEQFFSEHGECNDDNVKKSLEEETGFNLKEHVIDETPGSSSDEDYCVIVEDTEDEKGPKIPEVIVDQGQRHQKTVETAPKGPSTVVQPVRPEAVVEPMVRKDLPACDEVEVHLKVFQNTLFSLSNIIELKFTLYTESIICTFQKISLFVMY